MTNPNNAEPFDPDYAIRVGREVLAPIADYYFRLKLVGLENLPDPRGGRPMIFVANHAGRSFPWDAILLDYAITRHWVDGMGLDPSEKPRSLSARVLSTQPLLTPYRMPNWWKRVGCVDASAVNFSRLVRQGSHVIIFPEGIPGIARDSRFRYQLLPFPTSMVRVAQQYNAQIVPVSIVGSESFHPYARRVPPLDKIARKLGLPFLHLSPLLFLLPFLPFMYYAALPGKVTISFGQPLEPTEPVNEEVGWNSIAANLHDICQQQLDIARARYDKGLDLPGLLNTLLRAPVPFWRILPQYWPISFLKHAEKTFPELFPDLPPYWWFWLPLLGWVKPENLPEESSSGTMRVKPGRLVPQRAISN